MITIHERRIIIASEKKFNKKKAIIVAVIIAATLTACAGCNRLSPTELEEVVSDIKRQPKYQKAIPSLKLI